MNRSFTLLIVVIFMSSILLPAYATSVYKWVDTNGITHYSDEAPASSTTQVTLFEVPTIHTLAVDAENNYYSITNQWMRLHKERIEREKIELEKAKQKAPQSPVSPQIVYVNEPSEKRYVAAYPGFFQRRHGHRRFHDKSRYNTGDLRKKHLRGKSSVRLHSKRIILGSYKHRK